MEQELKQRLIGVTIIVALAVIFVPMLFDKREDKERAVNGVPPIPENVMETDLELPKSAEDLAPKDEKTTEQSGFKIIPLTEAPTTKPEAKGAAAEGESGHSAVEELVEPGGEEEDFGAAEVKPAKAAEKPPHEEPPKIAATHSGEKPAKSVAVERPAEPVKKPRPAEAAVKKPEPVTNVQTKAEAVAPAVKRPKSVEPAAMAAKQETAVAPAAKPVVSKPAVAISQPSKAAAVPEALKPQPAAPAQPVAKSVPESPAEMDVWVIQTGSFTSEAKARALAEKLRQSRFPAFVEAASSDHGTTYRVQVGPELDRARAEQTQKQIESSAGIKGIIVPHP